jgi:phage terminase Nu1 subunit (DNA packaging protein)
MSEKNEVPQWLRKAEFAAFIGRSPAYVTKLRKEGRLVLREDGVVKVRESLKLMADTAGGRVDVSERWAQLAGNVIPQAQADAASGDDAAPGGSPSPLQAAKARKELAQAEQEEMKAAQMRGDLIPREEVEAALRFVGGSIRGLLDVLPDQVAPLVAPVTALDEAHAILHDACRNVLEGFSQAISRQRDELAKGARK